MDTRNRFIVILGCLFVFLPGVALGEMIPGAIGNDGANGYDGTVTAVADSEIGSSGRYPPRAVDGSGLSADGTYTTGVNGANDVWLSAYGETTGYLAVNLGAQYTLGHLLFWNYQGDLARPQRGLKTADVYVSLVETPGFDFTNTTEWTLLLDDQVFNMAPGQNGIDFSQQVELGSTTARWVAFDIIDHYGTGDSDVNNANYVGVSEIQFFTEAVPEPATWAMCLLAAAGILLYRGRR